MKAPRLRSIRESRFMTQVELATAAGVHEITVTRLEAGQDAQMSTIRKLASALGVKPEELVGD